MRRRILYLNAVIISGIFGAFFWHAMNFPKVDASMSRYGITGFRNVSNDIKDVASHYNRGIRERIGNQIKLRRYVAGKVVYYPRGQKFISFDDSSMLIYSLVERVEAGDYTIQFSPCESAEGCEIYEAGWRKNKFIVHKGLLTDKSGKVYSYRGRDKFTVLFGGDVLKELW